MIGLDISETQLREAKSHLPNVDFRCHDINRSDLPLESNSVDLITAVQAAHWFDLARS